MDQLIYATFWGLVAGTALVIGALAGFYLRVSARVVAWVMAFGSGVLISALSFELMQKALETAGMVAAASGFLVGAVVYALANRMLAVRGAKHRKRSGALQPKEEDQAGSGAAIALGALLDGIPESIAIGLSILQGGAVSIAVVIAVFLSNLPEGMASAAGMKKAGRSSRYVFGVWLAIMVICGLSSLAGYTLFGTLPTFVIAATTAVAAGAILTMIVDTMIPEAFESAHDWAGLVAVLGFLTSFVISELG